METSSRVETTKELQRQPVIPNGIFAILLFITTEVMFFAGLISTYLVIRADFTEWPPWGQPRLPVEATAFNSMVLIVSAIFLYRANQSFIKEEEIAVVKKQVGIAFLLGVFFVLFQGYEWVQLISYGLTLTSSTYGGMFYLIIGAHGLHVLGGLLGVGYAYWRFNGAEGASYKKEEFLVPQLFWYFVVGVWPILYYLVYIM